MCKKIVIAAVAAVALLVVWNFTRLGSHAQLFWKQTVAHVQAQIPPEQEIARLRMELDNLAKEDDRHYHKVATQIVEVKEFEKEVTALVKQRDEREARIKAMYVASKSEGKFISYADQKFPRDKFLSELQDAADSFRTFEETVKNKEEQLALRQQRLESDRKRLNELKNEREKMKTELEKLQLALEQEKQAQAAAVNTLDDSGYLKLRGQMDEVRNRLEVEKQKRLLKGELDTSVRAAEQKKEREADLNAYIEKRFEKRADGDQ